MMAELAELLARGSVFLLLAAVTNPRLCWKHGADAVAGRSALLQFPIAGLNGVDFTAWNDSRI